MDYTLSATNITDTSFDIIITAAVATVGSKVLSLGVEDTSSPGTGTSFMITETGMAQGETITFPVGDGSGMTINSSTEYEITLDWSGMEMANPITVTTKSTGYDTPRTATQEQWEDLADRVNVRPIISSSIVPPISVEFVGTNNISNGAVTPAKIDMASLIDVLYPVGCYFETSDTTFDPNVSWGGTWVEDSAGKVTVSQDTNDTDFDTIGETGGNKVGYTMIRLGKNQAGFQSGTAPFNDRVLVANVPTTSSSNNNEYASTIQPYVVVKRWHRTA